MRVKRLHLEEGPYGLSNIDVYSYGKPSRPGTSEPKSPLLALPLFHEDSHHIGHDRRVIRVSVGNGAPVLVADAVCLPGAVKEGREWLLNFVHLCMEGN